MSRPHDPLSDPQVGSAWGLSETVPETQGLHAHEAERYAEAGRVGAGGMGVVDAVWDARLEREVARKGPTPGLEPNLAVALLAHEARVTARLDHPNVVSVHDAGVRPDGQPFFTMPLLRGRTLGQVLADPMGPERLPGLIRHLLDACRGVAHAHARGIVHADLKPSNVLVGERGETWVADWGLARTRSGEGPPVAPGAGTPPWTPAEVLAGAAPDERGDVYALGVILGQILDGTQAPVALRAVQRRATERDPQARYPDAHALGLELERWLDGRPVLAHAATPVELLVRLLWAWRVPLAGVAAVLVALTGALGVGAVRTARERDRAVAAEAELRQTAARLLADRAVAAMGLDDGIQAVDAARASMALGADPRAAGVLAAYPQLQPPPTSTAPLPDCHRFVRVFGEDVVCGDGVSLSWRDGAGELRGRWDLPATDAAPGADGRLLAVVRGEVVEVDPPTGQTTLLWPGAPERGLVGGGSGLFVDRLHVIELGEPLRSWSPCPERDTVDTAASAPAVGWWAVCSHGRLVHAPVGDDPQVISEGSGALARVVALDVDEAGVRLVAGTLDGEVIALDARTGEVAARLQAHVGPLRRVRWSPDGTLVVALGEQGRARLLRLTDGVLLDLLPVGEVRDLAWSTRAAQVLRVASQSLVGVDLRGEQRTRRWEEAEGISAAALSPDGRRLALGVGSHLVVRELPTGRRLHEDEGHLRIIKGVAFDGDQVVTASVDETDALRWHAVTDRGAERVEPLRGLRRVVRMSDGSVVASNFGRTVWIAPARGGSLLGLDVPRSVADLVAPDQGELAWGLDEAGALVRIRPEQGGFEVVEPAGAAADRRLAVSADGAWIARAGFDGVRVTSTEDARRVDLDVSGPDVTALALDGSGAHLALGYLDGRVEVWRLGGPELTWTAPGHAGRVSALAFFRDGGLVSTGWDGGVRLWGPALR